MHRFVAKIVVLSLVAMVASALGGCAGELPPAGNTLLKSGYDAYARGDDEAVDSSMTSFLSQYGKSNRADEAYFLRGLAKYRQKDLPSARADLSEAVARSRNGELRGKAMLSLADLYYDTGEIEVAVNMYRQSLNELPKGRPPADNALYGLGRALQCRGNWKEADAQFHLLAHYFRDSELAAIAARRAGCTYWTVQTGAFSGKANAEKAALRLRQQNLPAEVKLSRTGKSPMFVVQVGKYETYDQAADRLPDIRRFRADAFATPAK